MKISLPFAIMIHENGYKSEQQHASGTVCRHLYCMVCNVLSIQDNRMTKMRKTCFKILQRKISEQLEGKKEKATHIFQLPLISIRRRKNLKKKPSHNIHTTNVDEMRYKRVSYVKYIRIRSNLQESNGHGQKQLIAWQTFEFK
jgi:hypothetical protein